MPLAVRAGLLRGDPELGLASVVMTEDIKVLSMAVGLRITARAQADPGVAKVRRAQGSGWVPTWV